jgi:hypothetical protein
MTNAELVARWQVICEECQHDWVELVLSGEDPDEAGVQCPVCDSELLSASRVPADG